MNPIAPQLDSNSYVEFYKLRKAASTMTVKTIEWLCDQVKPLFEKHIHTDQHLSILSIGSGEGDIDLEFIKAITSHLSSQRLQYDALEPNLLHNQQFLDRANKISLNDQINLSVYNSYFDEFNGQEQYDVVLLIQVLYYFDNPYQAILRALSYTKPGGQVIIVHQSSIGIPEIQREYMYELKNNEDEMLTAEDIKELLDEGEVGYDFHHIDAHLDVTECLKQSEIGLKIMSFCLECDLSKVDDMVLDRLTQSFSKLTETGENGSVLLREPLGLFLIKTPTRKLAKDNDFVDDYRQLAQKFEWGDLFSQRTKSEIQVLDVACGTGRWLQAFQWYVMPHLLDTKISYNILDPSKSVISCLVDKIEAPIELGFEFTDTIQKANLPKKSYDIIWSMHGFYAIPCQALNSVLRKMYGSLNHKGRVFIAQTSYSSFYVEFYNRVLEAFHIPEQGFTSAENITEVLDMLSINYQVYPISYDECIPLSDLAALEHYILKEAIDNSFIKEKIVAQEGIPKKFAIEDILSHPKLDTYLRSFIRNKMFCFPQEVWLISFGKE